MMKRLLMVAAAGLVGTFFSSADSAIAKTGTPAHVTKQKPKSALGKKCAKRVAKIPHGGRDARGRTRNQVWKACLSGH